MEENECQPLSHRHILIPVVIIQLSMTLITLLAWIKSLYNTVDLAHPMYRLLHQEMIVMATFVSLDIVVLIVMAILEMSKAIMAAGIYVFVGVASLQFHQVTCLSVACIR